MNMLTWIIYIKIGVDRFYGGPTYRMLRCRCLCAFLFAHYRAMQQLNSFCSQVILNNANKAHSLIKKYQKVLL